MNGAPECRAGLGGRRSDLPMPTLSTMKPSRRWAPRLGAVELLEEPVEVYGLAGGEVYVGRDFEVFGDEAEDYVSSFA